MDQQVPRAGACGHPVQTDAGHLGAVAMNRPAGNFLLTEVAQRNQSIKVPTVPSDEISFRARQDIRR